MERKVPLSVLFFCLISVVRSQEYNAQSWNDASIYLRQAMNDTVKECEEFYDHVCGSYAANDIVSNHDAITKVLTKAIEKINLEDANITKHERAVKKFYNHCSSIGMKQNWLVDLYDAIAERIGEMSIFARNKTKNGKSQAPASFNGWRLMGQLQRQFGVSLAVDATVVYNESNCKRKAELQLEPLSMKEALLGIMTGLNKTAALAKALDLDPSSRRDYAEGWATNLVNIYKDWQNITTKEGGKRISLGNMTKEMPNFDWRAYLQGLLPDNVTKVLESDLENEIYVTNVQLLEKYGQLFKRHGEDAMRSLAFLKVLYESLKYFPEFPEVTPSDWCLEYAMRHLAPAMARLYFKEVNVPILDWRTEIQVLGRNIFSAFRFLLNSVDWLDSSEKEKLQNKVDDVTFNPGIPSWINDDATVMERIIVYNLSSSPFENEFRSYEAHLDRYTRHLASQDEIDEDDTEADPTFEENAEYFPSENSVNIYLGFMLPPMFNITYPLPVKYGGLGAIIGHELMHAFDSDDIYVGISDQDWLKEEALHQFEKKKQCIVRQYSRFCDRNVGRCVQGDKTIAENIADIDGIKVAYTAYKILTQVLGADPPIEDMLKYSGDQLFFLAYARTWCTSEAPSWTDFEDEHTPNKPRVELAIKNVPLFAKAFGCVVGTNYAPMRPCSLWGELLEPGKRRLK